LDLIARAISLRATDVHLVSLDDVQYQVRFRIDRNAIPYFNASIDRSILSIEDPVEFDVPFVRQLNVDEAMELR